MDKVVFVIGFRRSGTTLMKAILGSHPQIYMFPEDIPVENLPYKHTSEMDCKIVGLKRNTYTRDMPKLRSIYPNSKFIFMLRDSRDCIASQKEYDIKHNRRWNNQSVISLAHKWNMDLKYYYNAKKNIDGDIIKMKYEDMVRNSKGVINDICKFIGIEYDDRMMNYKERWKYGLSDGYTSYPDSTIDDGRIYTTSVNKWKDILSKRELLIIERMDMMSLKYEGYIDDKSN